MQEGSTRYWVAGRVSLDELSERLATRLRRRRRRDRRRAGVHAVRPRAEGGRVAEPRRLPHRRRARSSTAHRACVLRAVSKVAAERGRRMTLSLPLIITLAHRRGAHGRRHGGALGEPHLAAALGRTAAARRRGGGDVPRAAASAAHGGEHRRRAHAAHRRTVSRGGGARHRRRVVRARVRGFRDSRRAAHPARDRPALAVRDRAVRSADSSLYRSRDDADHRRRPRDRARHS